MIRAQLERDLVIWKHGYDQGKKARRKAFIEFLFSPIRPKKVKHYRV